MSPADTLRHYTDALKLTSADVASLTKKAIAGRQGIDAIYFQGAVLDPLDVLDEMESELGIPVLASNPAMVWCMLSRLGLHYRISGRGRLLSEWPPLPSE